MYSKQAGNNKHPSAKPKQILIGIVILAALVLAACQGQNQATPTAQVQAEEPVEEVVLEVAEDEQGVTPSVTVTDQSIESGKVTVAQVVSNGDGWLVVHAQADGKPGPILGLSPVKDGENSDVMIEIDAANATETLYAMLHTDAGEIGSFEFPDGPDGPVKVDEKIVTPLFKVTSGLVSVQPSVTVDDQEIINGIVKIAQVVSDGAGWLVVHAQADGKPGPILGLSPVKDGENSDVMVEIDTANATEILFAVLHTDAGEVGSFEFPDGPDGPVKVDEKVVTPSFTVTAGLAAETDSAEVESEALITLSGDDVLGPYLIGADGMTLYIFTRDELGVTNCYDQCAVNWPPLMLEEGAELTASEGVTGALATTQRDDGGIQVTYNGWPLYYWVKDEAPGDTTGHGVGAVWAVATPNISAYNFVPAESQVSYEVGETFLNDNNRFAVAIGVTSQIDGRIFLDPANPLAAWVAPVTIDISTLTSDSNRRDDKIRTDFLQSAQYPIATFVPTQIDGLPESYTPGEALDLQIQGDLTIREVTQPVTFQALIQGEEGNLRGEATATILMSDFGFGPISILGILETEDEVKLGFDFVASP